MKVFVDWSFTKGYEIIYEENGVITKNFSPELNVPQSSEIYVETGCPKHLLYQLVEKKHKVFVCDGRDIKTLRDKTKIKKSDENDVFLINKLYHENPDKFTELTKPNENEIRLDYLMGKYEQLTKTVKSLRVRKKFMEREYGKFGEYKNIIETLGDEKQRLLSLALPLVRYEYDEMKHIKGIGTTLVVRLLALAHPKKFSTLSKYLIYCGYKGCVLDRFTKGKGKRPNYEAKGLLHFMAMETMMLRDLIYRKVYDECKVRYSEENPDWTKTHVHNKALNIVATLIAKEFWYKLHSVGAEKSQTKSL